jgi:hypothetical protein
MDVWLMHHWKALSGGWLIPAAAWFYRRLGFRRLSVEGESWSFEYRKPEARALLDETRKSKSKR